jgi:hypothetical protein
MEASGGWFNRTVTARRNENRCNIARLAEGRPHRCDLRPVPCAVSRRGIARRADSRRARYFSAGPENGRSARPESPLMSPTLALILTYSSIAICAVIGVALMQVPRIVLRTVETLASPRNGVDRIAEEAVALEFAETTPSSDGVGPPTAAKAAVETYFEDGKWKNKVRGSSRAAHVHADKAAALVVGREMARKRRVDHIVRNKDGTIAGR